MTPVEHRLRYASRVYAPIGRELNDCAVRALALAASLSYQDAHDLLSWHGRQKDGVTRNAHKLYDVLFPECRIEATAGHHPMYDRPTVGQFLKAHPVGRFLCMVKGHAFAVRDGIVYDTVWTALKTRVWFAWDTSEG